LFVVYDSPICCVCDHPDHYRDQPGADFLKIVPTVWDDTRVLDGEVAHHLVMARRSGNDWFLGAMTDRNARDISINLNFLGTGRWKMTLWQDASDSAVNAENLERVERAVSTTGTVTLHLATAGGAVAHFSRE
jgi:alpha-glucosidase